MTDLGTLCECPACEDGYICRHGVGCIVDEAADAAKPTLNGVVRRLLSRRFVTRREFDILERNWLEVLKINDHLAKAAKSEGPVTPDELRARGWEGVSNCRCEDYEAAEYVPCPPLMCEAEALVQEVAELSRWHLIAFSLLNDEQIDEYRRRKSLTPDELQEALDA